MEQMTEIVIRCRSQDVDALVSFLRNRHSEIQNAYVERLRGLRGNADHTIRVGDILPRARSIRIGVPVNCSLNLAALAIEDVVGARYPIAVPIWG